jgi:hypothetical protein
MCYLYGKKKPTCIYGIFAFESDSSLAWLLASRTHPSTSQTPSNNHRATAAVTVRNSRPICSSLHQPRTTPTSRPCPAAAHQGRLPGPSRPQRRSGRHARRRHDRRLRARAAPTCPSGWFVPRTSWPRCRSSAPSCRCTRT